MRLRTHTLALAALALASCAAALAQEPEQKDQQVIDDFVVTRGMSLDPPGKQKQAQAKPAPTPRRGSSAKNRRPAAGSPAGDATAGKSQAGKGGAASKSDGGVAAPEASARAGGAAGGGAKIVQAGVRPLSLGFTIFLKERDRLTYADPAQDFRTGDRIAIAFESNADGYLYLFNSTGAAKTPDMIFPSASIDDGANALTTHTYETFPSEVDAGFVFTDPPGTERLFVVFSRQPLAGVPTGEALVNFCRGKGDDCAWPVSAALWARILDGAKGRRVKEARNAQLAQAAPPPDTMAMVQRGIRVNKSAPKPAFLRVNDTPDADTLVTEIVLTHK
ncbi:MAG: DUF4384 domain-containing protein [Acidobacteria bacterium]|nr:DUF4384 domain-containing protein [Acidobacteriota bacterium]